MAKKESSNQEIQAEPQAYTFAGINNPDGSALVIYATSTEEAHEKLQKYLKNMTESINQTLSNQPN